jgi:hypothetical protein
VGKSGKFFTTFIHRIIVATGILLFTILYFFEIDSLKNAQDKLLVNPVIWIMILLYPIIIWQEWKEKRKEEHTEKAEEDDESSARMSKKIFFFMLSTFLYLILMNYVGFIIMTIVYMPFLMWVLGTKSKKTLIILPIVFTVLLYILFNNLLGIPMPQGILLEGVL